MFSRQLIFIVGLLLSGFSYSQIPIQPYTQLSSLRVVSEKDSWVIDEKSHIGYRTRVNVTRGQDPFPFCFSVAAVLLWDQHRCQYDKKDCSAQERTSFLAVSSAGQQLPNSMLNHAQGGASFFSLSRIIDQGGAAPHSVCNYEAIENHRTPYGLFVSQTYQFIKQWERYKDYTPYLERLNRRAFKKVATKLNPKLTKNDLDRILDNSGKKTVDEIFSELMVNENCFTNNFIPDNRFKIERVKMGEVFNSRLTFETIDRLLNRNIPVMITFCANPEAKISSCLRHAAVVIARATAVNQITQDRRTAYWVINTWGEDWQTTHNDGWVFAENFINSAFGEIVWLEPR